MPTRKKADQVEGIALTPRRASTASAANPRPELVAPLDNDGNVVDGFVVKNILDAFGWQLYILQRSCRLSAGEDRLDTIHGRSWLHKLALFWFSLTMSSAFSGIASEGFAGHSISCSINHVLNDDAFTGKGIDYQYCIEIDDMAAQELELAPYQPQFRF